MTGKYMEGALYRIRTSFVSVMIDRCVRQGLSALECDFGRRVLSGFRDLEDACGFVLYGWQLKQRWADLCSGEWK